MNIRRNLETDDFLPGFCRLSETRAVVNAVIFGLDACVKTLFSGFPPRAAATLRTERR